MQIAVHCRFRLPLPIRTWYVLSNLSYMKRVMIEVFPTDWSPRKTCTTSNCFHPTVKPVPILVLAPRHQCPLQRLALFVLSGTAMRAIAARVTTVRHSCYLPVCTSPAGTPCSLAPCCKLGAEGHLDLAAQLREVGPSLAATALA